MQTGFYPLISPQIRVQQLPQQKLSFDGGSHYQRMIDMFQDSRQIYVDKITILETAKKEAAPTMEKAEKVLKSKDSQDAKDVAKAYLEYMEKQMKSLDDGIQESRRSLEDLDAKIADFRQKMNN